MRLSEALFDTRREEPAEADVLSHKLFVKAGFLDKLASGVYTYTHMMWRVIKKIKRIVTEEMENSGAQEVMLPILQPREIWDESGRWDEYIQDGILFHLEDRKGAEHCLGPTHEEVVTQLGKQQIESYRDLPVTVFQQQTKFRDEIRPRFGLMRAREFIMKDAYSFDRDEEGLRESYREMHDAYERIFERCGLEFIVVKAATGAIGGTGSEEFMVLADTGEDEILYSNHPDSDYAANREKAESIIPDNPDAEEEEAHKEHTPDIRSVDELAEFFDMSPKRMCKTLIYKAYWSDRVELVATLIRGDKDINENKLMESLGAAAVELADDETIEETTGAEVGFAGPVGIADRVDRVVADESLRGLKNFLCGCNETDYHMLDVNCGRDFPEPEFHDIRTANPGETSPDGKGELELTRGIEVGHIFQLGTKYSEAMDAYYLDEDNEQKPFVMGCYGLGTTRVAAAAIEQNHDDQGMVWPASIAPYHVVIIPISVDNEDYMEAAEHFYEKLNGAGIETVLDDRDARAGEKFNDAGLIGYPFKLIVGDTTLEGDIELERRRDDETLTVAESELVATLKDELGLNE